MTNKTVISLTAEAVQHFQTVLKTGQWLRLAVKPSGCSGYEYDLSVCDHLDESCIEEAHGDIHVLIAKKSITYLLGTQIDHQVMSAGQSKVVFHNPQAQDYCGCGVSFSIKEQANEA